MISRLLSLCNFFLFGVSVVLSLLLLNFSLFSEKEISLSDLEKKPLSLPKRSFVQESQAYDSLGDKYLSLKSQAAVLELPDLRSSLIYYGLSGRPDANLDTKSLHVALKNDNNSHTINEGKALYLIYDRTKSPAYYIPSTGNAETSLWIELHEREGEALVSVKMKNEKGEFIEEPHDVSQFTVKAREPLRTKSGSWELGQWRVDGTLLARQRARWFGIDRFLEEHGGDEFEVARHKQRIDFGEGSDVYSVFVGEGDSLIWKSNRWQSIEPGYSSRDYPLLHVKKVSERILNAELWDVEGKNKVLLNLIKSTDVAVAKNVSHDFRFIGLKTRKQVIVEVQGERMILRPQDWLLQDEGMWRKLSSLDDIDGYVERRLSGPMFIFEGISIQDEQQYLSGMLYNNSRSSFEEVKLPIGGVLGNHSQTKDNKEERVMSVKEFAIDVPNEFENEDN